MVTVVPGQKVLSSHVNAKLDIDGSDNKMTTNFVPAVGNSFDLGLTGTRWKDLFLSGTAYGSLSGNVTGDVVGGIEPATNGAKSVGTSTKGMAYVYLKDTANTNVYRLEVVSGVLQATLI